MIAAAGTVLGALVVPLFGVHVGAAAGAQAQQAALNKVRATNQQAQDAAHQNTTSWRRPRSRRNRVARRRTSSWRLSNDPKSGPAMEVADPDSFRSGQALTS